MWNFTNIALFATNEQAVQNKSDCYRVSTLDRNRT